MFKAVNINTNEVVNIYSVVEGREIRFLIWDGKWRYVRADMFIPVAEAWLNKKAVECIEDPTLM